MTDVRDAFAGLIAALERRQIAYAIAGEFAAAAIDPDARPLPILELLVAEDALAAAGEVAREHSLEPYVEIHLRASSDDLESWRSRECVTWEYGALWIAQTRTPTTWDRPVDYSDRAVTMRLRQVSQLRTLCLSLARAKPIAPPPDPPPASPPKPDPC